MATKNKKDDIIMLTLAEKEVLEKKLEQLIKEEKPKISAMIKEAVAMGDLSENESYTYAKEQMRDLERQVHEITEKLENAQIIQTSTTGVSVYSEVTITFLKDKRKEKFTLVGSTEADPINKKYSASSPLGRAVLGAQEGDIVSYETPRGEKVEIKIEKIKK